MKGTSIWDEVRELYPDLKTDDEIADEVIAQYSGRRGAERLRAEMRKVGESNMSLTDKARAIAAIENVRQALAKFWKGVCDFLHIHYTTAEDVADRVLRDLLEGVNPNEFIRENDKRVREQGETEAIVAKAKADGSYMKAPNGKPSKFNEQQWAQVRTKAFKEWFGDWETDPKNASKIVDENGEPLVVYHGSGESEFNIFEKGDIGFHFGNYYQALMRNYMTVDHEGVIRPFFLSIKNPLRLNGDVRNWNGNVMAKNLMDNEGHEGIGGWVPGGARINPFTNESDLKELKRIAVMETEESNKAMREFIKSKGYDGVVYENAVEVSPEENDTTDSKIAFSPNQIKSATENTGEFSRNNNDFRYQLGDPADTFRARQQRAVEQKGVVAPGLNEAEVDIVNVPKHNYTGNIKEATKQAIDAATEKYAPNSKPIVQHYDNHGQKFDYIISGNSITESLNPNQQNKSVEKGGNKGAHLALAEHLDEVINNSIEVEEHPDYRKNKQGERSTANVNSEALMHRFYGAVNIDGETYRVMTLMREDNGSPIKKGVRAYEVQTIEVLNEESPSTSNDAGSIEQERSIYPLANLLKDVEKSYDSGKKLLDESQNADNDLLRTSDELTDEYGTRWLDEQTADDGRHTTQVKNTINSYKKFGEWVKADSQGRDVSVLDASSGLGLGTQWMRENGINADDVEPYPSANREIPTFGSYAEVNKKYDYIISNAVLNVIPDDWRANVLHDMADKLKVGGKMVINVRGAQSIREQGVEGKTKITLDDPSEILVLRPDGSIRAYQKGFTKPELKEWTEKELGEGYSVEIANTKNAGGSYDTAVVVTKNNESDTKRTASELGLPTPKGASVAMVDANVQINSERAKKLSEIISKIDNKDGLGAHELIHEIVSAMAIEDGKNLSTDKSRYFNISENVSVRITDHRGNAETYKRHGEENGEHYGLVIKLKPNRFKEHKDVDYLEFVYFPDRLDASQQKEIVNGLSRLLQTGDYSLFAKANEVNGSGKFKDVGKKIATEDRTFRYGEGELTDDALSEANDAVARVLGESRRSRAQRKRFAERERSRMRKAAERLAGKLHLDNIDIVDDGAQFGDKRAKAKGYLASLAEETK